MASDLHLEHRVAFDPANAEAILLEIPAAPGVFALRGEREGDQPYLTRAADLRRRLRRLLAPPEVDAEGRAVLSKRLNLRDRVRWIEYARVGSAFEGALVLYRASCAAFGEGEARKRLRLHPPAMLRLTVRDDHPRIYVTNHITRKNLHECFGPFASRGAAERAAEGAAEFFKLRRCHEALEVHPEHPGCVYGEIGRCMAPCKIAVTPEVYAAEAERAMAFLRTRGESLLAEIAAGRDKASEEMDFERAATLHAQWEKVKETAQAADPIVRPIAEVRALVVQEAAPRAGERRTDDAAVFLLENGRLLGPARLSTLGVRAVREQTAVGSSLFAQPLMLAPVALEGAVSSLEAEAEPVSGISVKHTPDERVRFVVESLTRLANEAGEADPVEHGEALALFKRWYYRPANQRFGEVLLPNVDGSWPMRRLLNAAARVVLGTPTEAAPVDREAAAEIKAESKRELKKTRVLHEGREGVEREVPVLPKRPRRRGAVTPAQLAD